MIIKIAVSRWKMADLSEGALDILKSQNILKDKTTYVRGLYKGNKNIARKMKSKYGIEIISKTPSSHFMNVGDSTIRIPIPNATMKIDSKRYFTLAPKAKDSLHGMDPRVSKENVSMLNLLTQRHELDEIRAIERKTKTNAPNKLSNEIISDIKLNGLTDSNVTSIDPSVIATPNFFSHFDKSVILREKKNLGKIPFKDIKEQVNMLRTREHSSL